MVDDQSEFVKDLLSMAGFRDTQNEADDDTPHEGELADVPMATEIIEDTPPSTSDPLDEGKIADVTLATMVIEAALDRQAGQELPIEETGIIEDTPPSTAEQPQGNEVHITEMETTEEGPV